MNKRMTGAYIASNSNNRSNSSQRSKIKTRETKKSGFTRQFTTVFDATISPAPSQAKLNTTMSRKSEKTSKTVKTEGTVEQAKRYAKYNKNLPFFTIE
jgi:hypothetical protein